MPLIKRLLSRRWTLTLLLIAVLPLSIRGAVIAWQSISNDVADWMPDDFGATQELRRFGRLFGSDESLMISWDGCTLDDARIDAYRRELIAPVVDPETGEAMPLFREVLTGPRMLEEFQSSPLDMTRRRALNRMSGWIISPDAEQTCVLAMISKTGSADRHLAIASVFAAADRVDGLGSDAIHAAGTMIESVAIDQASQKSLLELNLALYAICMLIMVVCLRSFRAAVPVFLLALFNQQMALALIHYFGSGMDSILLLTANLTFVLTISIGIHLVNYYRDALATHPPHEAPAYAFQMALKPTALATITTSFGLASLSISRTIPISRFGKFSAISILLAAGIAIVYTSLYFQTWPLRTAQPVDDANGREGGSSLFGLWMRAIKALRWPVLLVTLAILMLGGTGARKLRTLVGLSELLSPEAKAVRDYAYLEEKVGPLIPVEVVLQMPKGDARTLLAQYRAVSTLHGALAALDERNTVVSVATFSPPAPPEKGGVRQIIQAVAIRRNLDASRQQFQEMGYLRTREDEDHFYWRIMLRTPATGNIHYGTLLERIESTIEATFQSLPESVRPVDTMVCGSVPLVHQVQEQMLTDLIRSFLLAFVLVSVTLMLLFRSVLCGLICMIPNMLPSVVVFGTLGWFDVPIELGTILTASAALGIAVDDLLHYITWFQRNIAQGGTIAESVRFAYRRCGTAMIQTTLICSLGLVVFSLSSFAPMARFGWCMFALLLLALAADLIVLPAILLSPLGKPFVPKKL